MMKTHVAVDSAILKRALGRVLRELRKRENRSVEATAADIDMDRAFFAALERGEREPSISTFCRLAEAFELIPARLLRMVWADYEKLSADKPPTSISPFEREIRRLCHYIDQFPVMGWIATPERQCLYVNQHILKYTGHTLEELRGDGWTRDIHPEDLASVQQNAKAFDRRQPYTNIYRYRDVDGQYVWVVQQATPQFSSKGVFIGYVGSLMAVSDEERERIRLINTKMR